MHTNTFITFNIASTKASPLDLADEIPRSVVSFYADLAGLPLVPVGEDPQQEVRSRGRIVRALDDERRTPPRVEALADLGLGLGEVEALLVPLQHGVAADDALFVAAFIGTPAVDSRWQTAGEPE